MSGCDPDFGNVVLLLPFNGTNGGTTTTDVSSYANTVDINAAAVALSNSSPAFAGDLYLNVPVASWYNTYACAVPFTLGTPLDVLSGAAWTIECWVKVTYPGATSFPMWVFSYNGTSATAPDGAFYGLACALLDNNNGTVTLSFDGSEVFNAGVVAMGQTFTVSEGSWNHVAVTSDGTTGRAFFNGQLLSTLPTGWIQANYSPPSTNPNVIIGSNTQESGTAQPGGIEQFRVSNICRYNASFTPPSGPFPTISCTQPVPDIVGLASPTLANTAITTAGFTVGTATGVGSGDPAGQILTQSPTYPNNYTLGDPIDYTYSLGGATATVPNVVNTSATVVAPGILTGSGFTVGVVTYAPSAIIIPGNVISQDPAAGSTESVGSAVDLVVSSGLPSLTVPDLYGLTQSDAIALLLSLGLTVGGVGSAPSQFVPAGEVQLQNPSAGTAVAAGSVVSFVLSLGTLAVGTVFDFEQTVISQYANSPTILQLVQNLNQYIDQSANFANFFNYVWNVDTAQGFGLDIWGKIVGVNRLLHIPNTTDYVGFDNSATPPPDWQTMGSDQPPQPAVGGAMYTGYNATQAYLLPDDAYRQLILAKAFANICATTAPAINTILQNLYGPGTAWVLNTGPMAISYNLSFTPTAIQLAILEQSGVIPTPPGVAVVINTGV